MILAILPAFAFAAPAPPAPGAAGPGWLAQTGAELRVLDKINARVRPLSVPVGGSAAVGSLTVTVRGCVIRPPDQAADAAAFLEITDTRPGAGSFRGWVFANEPAVDVFENPVYDVRVTGCRA